MMKKRQHFLITKFNQAMIEVDSERPKLHNSTHWLDKRFTLFKDFCFPSVVGQTNQNFYWLVFFDKDIPSQYCSTIFNFRKRFSNFVPVFTTGVTSEIDQYKIEIEKYLKEDTEILITTRFDSDDALNATFIDYIQKNLSDNRIDYFINFSCGIQYDITHQVLCRSKQHSNPFLTRIEELSNGAFKTVLQLFSHQDAKRIYSVTDLLMEDMWLQIIHSDNLLNSLGLRRLPLIFSRRVNSKFCLNRPIRVSFVKSYIFYFRRILQKLLQGKKGRKYE